MVKEQIETSKNKFSYIKEKRMNIYQSEQILTPLDDFFYLVKKGQMTFDLPIDTDEERIKAEEVF